MRLAPLDRGNWRAAGALRVAPGQLGMMPEHEPIAFDILARSYLGLGGGVWHPLACYAPELVGVMALVDEGSSTWALRSLMIGAEFQGRGHGRAAVLAAVDFARERGASSLGLTVQQANLPAIALYESLGFSQSEARGSDLGMRLQL